MSALTVLHQNDNVTKGFEQLLFYAIDVRTELSRKYGMHGRNDPRHCVADRLTRLLFAGLSCAIQAREDFTRSTWWEEHGLAAVLEQPSLAKGLTRGHAPLEGASVTFFSYALVESGIRRIARALEPNANNGGNANFPRVSSRLFLVLEPHWRFSLGDPAAFLSLFRSFRNTLPNNGYFLPENRKDHSVSWRGRTFDFVYGEVPAFAKWPFEFMLLRDLVTLTHEIMLVSAIAKLSSIP